MTNTRNRFHLLFRCSILIMLTLASLASGQSFEWIRAIDGTTPGEESIHAADFEGNLYVAGTISGTLAGQSSAGLGGRDAFVIKYDANGTEIWTRQFGASFDDLAQGIAVDATGIYVTGITFGTFSGQTNAGDFDAFVRKYDSDGNAIWTRQFGTTSYDNALGIATDAGGIYIVGGTGGDFPGYTNAGHTDAFVRKYDANGNEAWTRQLGTSSHEYAYSIFGDATGVYVAGGTEGTFPGQTNAGSSDVFVRKDDGSGAEVWTRQFGTSARDEGWAIAGDATNLYVAGRTEGFFPGEPGTGSKGAFVRKCDLNGNEVWTRQFGTVVALWPPPESANAVSVDASGVYVVGTMNKTPLGPGGTVDFDVYVRKYDVNGTEVWTRLFGTLESESGKGVATDGSGIYVVGGSNGTLPGQTRVREGNDPDAFVRKYDVSGNEVWTHQIGTLRPSYEQATAVDANGGIYVTGYVYGTLPGQAYAGLYDAFVRKYDASGAEVWTRQFGSSEYEFAFDIAVDASGVYVTGTTQAALPGQVHAGGADVFVRKYDASGTEIWTRQFGTSLFEFTSNISVDPSGVYVAGSTQGEFPGQSSSGATDAFVRKYDLNGNEVWTRQFGTASSESVGGVVVQAAAIYVTGFTSGAFAGQTNAGSSDIYVRKYDSNGNEIWTRQFGTSSSERAHGIAADATGIYVAGRTSGTLPGQTASGNIDAFVRKYDANGIEAWTRQFGGALEGSSLAIAVNATGVYLAGGIEGQLPGQTLASGNAFAAKYGADGTHIWTQVFGTWFDEEAKGVAVDATGLYVGGYTAGDLTMPDYVGGGNTNAFVVKINSSPAEANEALIAIVTDLFDGGLENSLTVKLQNALSSLAGGNTQTAINQLQSFINQVTAQRGKAISTSDADMLIAQAQAIINMLTGGGAPKHAGANEDLATVKSFQLFQNYPNPFNPETEIRFQLAEPSPVAVKIFNTLGAEVRTLAEGQYHAGFHTVRWDGKDRNGNTVTSGVYFCQFQAGVVTQMMKMNLLR